MQHDLCFSKNATRHFVNATSQSENGLWPLTERKVCPEPHQQGKHANMLCKKMQLGTPCHPHRPFSVLNLTAQPQPQAETLALGTPLNLLLITPFFQAALTGKLKCCSSV